VAPARESAHTERRRCNGDCRRPHPLVPLRGKQVCITIIDTIILNIHTNDAYIFDTGHQILPHFEWIHSSGHLERVDRAPHRVRPPPILLRGLVYRRKTRKVLPGAVQKAHTRYAVPHGPVARGLHAAQEVSTPY
jgi:hypothetical protein